MWARQSPGRNLRLAPHLALTSVLTVVILTMPVGAITPSSTTFYSPYRKAALIAKIIESAAPFGRTAKINVTSPASANRSNGDVSMAMNAWAGHYPRGMPFVVVGGRAGFILPFKVVSNRSYNVSAHWSLSWSATVSGGSDCRRSGLDSVIGWSDFGVWDHTTQSGVGNWTSYYFLRINSCWNSTKSSTGVLNVTFATSASLVQGDQYEIYAYLSATLFVQNSGGNWNSRAFFDMAGPRGATLNWVAVR